MSSAIICVFFCKDDCKYCRKSTKVFCLDLVGKWYPGHQSKSPNAVLAEPESFSILRLLLQNVTRLFTALKFFCKFFLVQNEYVSVCYLNSQNISFNPLMKYLLAISELQKISGRQYIFPLVFALSMTCMNNKIRQQNSKLEFLEQLIVVIGIGNHQKNDQVDISFDEAPTATIIMKCRCGFKEYVMIKTRFSVKGVLLERWQKYYRI